jgi:PHD/YefM family antitoxin component YafN of YafNO toxin-antitoxin module
MSARRHTSYDVSIVAPSLESLHQHVTTTKSRIEITRPGSDQRCVLISAEELATLERALEILSATEGYRDISDRIASLAARLEAASYAS